MTADPLTPPLTPEQIAHQMLFGAILNDADGAEVIRTYAQQQVERALEQAAQLVHEMSCATDAEYRRKERMAEQIRHLGGTQS